MNADIEYSCADCIFYNQIAGYCTLHHDVSEEHTACYDFEEK